MVILSVGVKIKEYQKNGIMVLYFCQALSGCIDIFVYILYYSISTVASYMNAAFFIHKIGVIAY